VNVSKRAGVVVLVGCAVLLSAGLSHAQDATRGADRAAAPPPADVYAESGNRLPLPKRDDVDEDARKIFDDMTRKSPRPLPRLYDPKLAKPMSEAAYYLKNETGLPSRLLEIAVLVTAREMDCQFEWTQNEPHGRDPANPHHIDPAIIEAIKFGRPTTGLGEKEQAVIAFGREMIGQKKVSPPTFAKVVRLFGRKETVELVELMANYSAAALELAAFDQQLKVGQSPLLPPRHKPE